ncbi:MAG: protein kinase, partial [bacterium]
MSEDFLNKYKTALYGLSAVLNTPESAPNRHAVCAYLEVVAGLAGKTAEEILKPYEKDIYLKYEAVEAMFEAIGEAPKMDFYKEALKINSKDTPVLRGIGKLYLKQGDYPAAFTVLKKAFDIDQKDAEALLLLAETKILSGEYDEAFKYLGAAGLIIKTSADEATYRVLQLAQYIFSGTTFMLKGEVDKFQAFAEKTPPKSIYDFNRLLTLGMGKENILMAGTHKAVLFYAVDLASGIINAKQFGEATKNLKWAQATVIGDKAETIALAGPTEKGKKALGTSTLIAGKYRLLKELGRGGMGIVYEALNTSINKKVAVKRLREELKMKPKQRENLLSEARLVAHLQQENILEVYDIVEAGGDIYIIFEFVDGKSIEALLEEKGNFAVAKTVKIIKEVCSAIGFSHKEGIVHRDIKPSNIMVTKTGIAKVMDFGIARTIKDTMSRSTGATSGTLAYMAPEQEMGKGDERVDIYAIGVTMYEMLTGDLPFKGP